MQVTATADWKVTDTAEAIAAATSQSTPPLTPVTTCSASSTRSTTSESSNFKASSESYCDSNDSNDSIDEENDPRKDNEVGDPSLLDGDDGSVVETATEVRREMRDAVGVQVWQTFVWMALDALHILFPAFINAKST